MGVGDSRCSLLTCAGSGALERVELGRTCKEPVTGYGVCCSALLSFLLISTIISKLVLDITTSNRGETDPSGWVLPVRSSTQTRLRRDLA